MECIRTSVPRSEAVASSLPSNDSAMHTSGELCAWMNLVRRTSYSSTRTCSSFRSVYCLQEAGRECAVPSWASHLQHILQ